MTEYLNERVHVVTGATGFVGAALVLRLLEDTQDRVVCIVRGAGDAAERLSTALREAAIAYNASHVVAQGLGRVRAAAGDITDATKPDVPEGGIWWHVAASLRFEDRHRAEIREQNIGGTQNVLRWAEASAAIEFNYVSTAYSCGETTGTIAEARHSDRSAGFHNAYEESKVEAEDLVDVSVIPLARVMRPSIVIGDSATAAATSFTGLYGFIREFDRFIAEVSGQLGELLLLRPLRLVADPTVPLNVIPVDAVVADMVALHLRRAPGGYYHLTNPAPPTVGACLEEFFTRLGLAQPLYVEHERSLSTIDKVLNDKIPFYAPYMSGGREFSRERVDAVLGSEGRTCAGIGQPGIEPYMNWYLDYLGNSRREVTM